MKELGKLIKWNDRIYKVIGEIKGHALCLQSIDNSKCSNCGYDLGKYQFTSIPTSPNHKENAKEVTQEDLLKLIEKNNSYYVGETRYDSIEDFLINMPSLVQSNKTGKIYSAPHDYIDDNSHDRFIDNMCLSYDSDFDHQDDDYKNSMRNQCRRWIRAFNNNKKG